MLLLGRAATHRFTSLPATAEPPADSRISSNDSTDDPSALKQLHCVEEKIVNMPEQTVWDLHGGQSLRRMIGLFVLCALTPFATARASEQESFGSPEAGVAALVEAVKANDQEMLRSILGPHSRKLVSSGDEVADAKSREAFIKNYGEANKIVLESDSQATLLIGDDEWPLPIPLVQSEGRWHFDSKQGEKEILARRIGANELAAIQVCLAIVDAEHE